MQILEVRLHGVGIYGYVKIDDGWKRHRETSVMQCFQRCNLLEHSKYRSKGRVISFNVSNREQQPKRRLCFSYI
jgi:hypothetical protein